LMKCGWMKCLSCVSSFNVLPKHSIRLFSTKKKKLREKALNPLFPKTDGKVYFKQFVEKSSDKATDNQFISSVFKNKYQDNTEWKELVIPPIDAKQETSVAPFNVDETPPALTNNGNGIAVLPDSKESKIEDVSVKPKGREEDFDYVEVLPSGEKVHVKKVDGGVMVGDSFVPKEIAWGLDPKSRQQEKQNQQAKEKEYGDDVEEKGNNPIDYNRIKRDKRRRKNEEFVVHSSVRQTRVANAIRTILEKALFSSDKHHVLKMLEASPANNINYLKVEMTRDLRIARVYWGTQFKWKEEAVEKYLQSKQASLRAQVARDLNIRFCPQLEFVYQENSDEVLKKKQDIVEMEKFFMNLKL